VTLLSRPAFLVCCTAFALAAAPPPTDSSQAPAPPRVDTATFDSAFDTSTTTDTAAADIQKEEEFQTSIDSLLDSAGVVLDTAGWDTLHVSAGHFASESWTDTAAIVLVDSARGKRYCQPCPGPVTSNFGQRSYRWHYGVDTKLNKGDTVRSAFDGIVRLIGFDRHGYGHVIVVHHADGLETIYGHLSKKLVKLRQRVAAGEVIGLGGNTGHSTGPHLHFEIRYRGEPIDPNDIVDFENFRLKYDTLVLTKDNFAYLVELRKQKWCTVVKGDYLGRIARRYHSTVTKLCQLNHISGKTILRVGRQLRYQ
jgi:murein DD-endopeptidase MepM/ murein hydrolase activator NlpD